MYGTLASHHAPSPQYFLMTLAKQPAPQEAGLTLGDLPGAASDKLTFTPPYNINRKPSEDQLE